MQFVQDSIGQVHLLDLPHSAMEQLVIFFVLKLTYLILSN